MLKKFAICIGCLLAGTGFSRGDLDDDIIRSIYLKQYDAAKTDIMKCCEDSSIPLNEDSVLSECLKCFQREIDCARQKSPSPGEVTLRILKEKIEEFDGEDAKKYRLFLRWRACGKPLRPRMEKRYYLLSLCGFWQAQSQFESSVTINNDQIIKKMRDIITPIAFGENSEVNSDVFKWVFAELQKFFWEVFQVFNSKKSVADSTYKCNPPV